MTSSDLVSNTSPTPLSLEDAQDSPGCLWTDYGIAIVIADSKVIQPKMKVRGNTLVLGRSQGPTIYTKE